MQYTPFQILLSRHQDRLPRRWKGATSKPSSLPLYHSSCPVLSACISTSLLCILKISHSPCSCSVRFFSSPNSFLSCSACASNFIFSVSFWAVLSQLFLPQPLPFQFQLPISTFVSFWASAFWASISIFLVSASFSIFRLDALALSVIATATWLGGWLGGCHTPVLYQNC